MLFFSFDNRNSKKNVFPFFSVCKRWNGLMSLFCFQMTTLFVYDYGVEYDNSLLIGTKNNLINESQLLRIAASTPNVRSLHLNRHVRGITPDGIDRLAQLWPRVEELDLEGGDFYEQVLVTLTRHFPLLRKFKMEGRFYGSAQLFDTIFSNHRNLVEFECNFHFGADQNWFRSCHVPLERFAVNHFWGGNATLDTLENCCKDSLKTIQVVFGLKGQSELIGRILSTFHELRVVSFGNFEFSLRSPPVLPHLEKFCLLSQFSENELENLIDFLKSYPHLKELHLERWTADDRSVEKLATSLPYLRSLTFYSSQLTRAGWMKLSALKLESFNAGLTNCAIESDLRAFVGQMPFLQRLTVWDVRFRWNDHFLSLFKSIRDDIRASGSDRQLWVSRDGVRFFALDSSDKCTDEAIEKFFTEMNKKHRPNC